MKLTNSFHIARPPVEVFDAFLDVERVATCMPGSQLLGEPEPGTYEGEVKVKVGPLGVAYSGRLQLLEADREALRLTMRAKGREQRGAGNADAHVMAQLAEQDGGTLVSIDTDLSVRGKVAQFGRGVIGEVTDQIMQTFAANVEQLLTAGPDAAAAGAATPAAGPARTSAPTSEPTAAAAAAPSAAGGDDLDVWALLVRPALQRHAGSVATVVCSGIAAYLGARAGTRRRHR